METSDRTFSAAKLREHIRGNVKENNDLYSHTGILDPNSKSQEMLSFLESIYDPHHDDLPHDLQATRAAETIRRSAASRHVGKEIEDTPAFAVGMTEREVEISQARAFGKIQSSILNNGAPYTTVFFGGMNTGKTSMACLYVELWKDLASLKYNTNLDPVVISNAASLEVADYVAQDISRFRELVFGSDEWFESDGETGEPPVIDPNTPTFWLFDECSTHLDARTNSYEVANQYTPLLKRFAKVNVDAAHIGHSGLDVHAELRRPTIITEFIFKTGLKTADIYNSMDDDRGTDQKYELTEIPDTSLNLDPDDFAPWSWE
jgi:hypothetical protein